jgi:hypothetical protein
MRKCLDVQVLELLIRKQWPTVARHIALLFDILMGMEQPDASKLIEGLSKHRECEELVPICTSLLLRHSTQLGSIRSESGNLLGFLSQSIPSTGKKRRHGATFVDRVLRLAMSATSGNDASVFKSSLENLILMRAKNDAGVQSE